MIKFKFSEDTHTLLSETSLIIRDGKLPSVGDTVNVCDIDHMITCYVKEVSETEIKVKADSREDASFNFDCFKECTLVLL